MQLHIWVVHLLECRTDFLNDVSILCSTFKMNVPKRSALSVSERLSKTMNQNRHDFQRTCIRNLYLCSFQDEDPDVA